MSSQEQEQDYNVEGDDQNKFASPSQHYDFPGHAQPAHPSQQHPPGSEELEFKNDDQDENEEDEEGFDDGGQLSSFAGSNSGRKKSQRRRRQSNGPSRQPAYINIKNLLNRGIIPDSALVETYYDELGIELTPQLITHWNQVVGKENNLIDLQNRGKRKDKKIPRIPSFELRGKAGQRLPAPEHTPRKRTHKPSAQAQELLKLEGIGESSSTQGDNIEITPGTKASDVTVLMNPLAAPKSSFGALKNSLSIPKNSVAYKRKAEMAFAVGLQATGVANSLAHDLADLIRSLRNSATPVADPAVHNTLSRIKSRNYEEDLALPRKTFGVSKEDDRIFTIIPKDAIDSQRMTEMRSRCHRFAFQDDGRIIKNKLFRGNDHVLKNVTTVNELWDVKLGNLPDQAQLDFFGEARLSQIRVTPEEMLLIKNHREKNPPIIPAEAPPHGVLDAIMNLPSTQTEPSPVAQDPTGPTQAREAAPQTVEKVPETAAPVPRAFNALQLKLADPNYTPPNWEEQVKLKEEAEQKWKKSGSPTTFWDDARYDAWYQVHKKYPKHKRLAALQPFKVGQPGWHAFMADTFKPAQRKPDTLERYLEYVKNLESKGQKPYDLEDDNTAPIDLEAPLKVIDSFSMLPPVVIEPEQACNIAMEITESQPSVLPHLPRTIQNSQEALPDDFRRPPAFTRAPSPMIQQPMNANEAVPTPPHHSMHYLQHTLESQQNEQLFNRLQEAPHQHLQYGVPQNMNAQQMNAHYMNPTPRFFTSSQALRHYTAAPQGLYRTGGSPPFAPLPQANYNFDVNPGPTQHYGGLGPPQHHSQYLQQFYPTYQQFQPGSEQSSPAPSQDPSDGPPSGKKRKQTNHHKS